MTKLFKNSPGAGGNVLKQVTTEDLVNYGFMPEFIGRFPVIITLDKLTEQDLVDIMTKPADALVNQYKAVFRQCNIALEIPQAALFEIARQAIRLNTGARGLQAIMDEYLSPVLFNKAGISRERAETLILNNPPPRFATE